MRAEEIQVGQRVQLVHHSQDSKMALSLGTIGTVRVPPPGSPDAITASFEGWTGVEWDTIKPPYGHTLDNVITQSPYRGWNVECKNLELALPPPPPLPVQGGRALAELEEAAP